MNEKKPIPMIAQRGAQDCPVCGKPSYSRMGVHPQCAVLQADAPRKLRLAAAKAKARKKDNKR